MDEFNMNELPSHVLLKILDYLPTVVAIRCRVVCKSWLDLIDQFVLDELNVFFAQRQCTKYFQFRNCFSNPNRSISFGESAFYRMVIENEQFDHLFKNLKKFAFEENHSYQDDNYDELKKLINSFKNLEHLYLVGTSLPSIKLAKLKTFECSYFNENGNAEGGSKLLDCPELLALAIDWEEDDAPVLKCPKLRYLKCVQYGAWVSQLDSLEVLNLNELETNSGGILRNHPKLHTLNVFHAEKAVLEKVIQSKRELGRGHLKVFVRSLPVDGEMLKAFGEIFEKREVSLGHFTAKGIEFYSKHEQEFRDDFFVFSEYETIVIDRESFANLKLLTDRTAIFRKVRRIYALQINDQINGQDLFSQDHLINLMKQIPNVHHLTCKYVGLDQAFFDQLPSIFEFLNILYIWNSETVDPVDLRNVSFILRFRELKTFFAKGHKYSDEDRPILNAFKKKNALDFDSIVRSTIRSN